MDRAVLQPRLLRILVTVVAMLSVVLGGGLLLPRSWQVERELLLSAPPEAVYPHVIGLKRWREWSVALWPQADVTVEYSGPESGTGATARWNTGTRRGVIKIMDTLRNRRMDYELLVDGSVIGLNGVIRLQPEDHGTRVFWRTGGQSGANPIARYAALFDRYRIGGELDASLARLRARVEEKK